MEFQIFQASSWRLALQPQRLPFPDPDPDEERSAAEKAPGAVAMDEAHKSLFAV